MSYANANREDVAAIFGDIDPAIVEYIVETGATIDEIADAIAMLEAGSTHTRDERGSEPWSRATTATTEVHAVLEPLFEESKGGVR